MIIKNKKATGIVVGAFGIIAIISTGFAGWTITSEAGGSANGTITVDSGVSGLILQEYGWDVGGSSLASTTNIVYAGLATNPSGAWFTWSNTGETGFEKLTATLKVTIDGFVSANTYNVTGVTTAVNSYYSAAYDAGVVGGLPTLENGQVTVASDNGTYTSSSKTFTGATGTVVFTFVLTFKWGAAFDGKNPVTFFNENQKKASDLYVATAAPAALSGKTYAQAAALTLGTGTAFANLANESFLFAFTVEKQ